MRPQKSLLMFLILIVLATVGTLAFAGEVLTNAKIIELVNAKLSDDVIATMIQGSECSFTTDVNSVLALKKIGVSDKVIQAMVSKMSASSSTSKPVATQSADDPNDPTKPHPAGIYYLDDEKKQFVKIFPSVYSQTKSGGFFKSAMTFGVAKIKSKAVVAGARARLQLTTARPSFYFYFENTESGLSNSGGIMGVSQPAVSPNEFVLVKTEVKKNSRELVVGQMNAFGAQSGTLDKFVRPFDYEDVAPGIFKVTPTVDLQSGEYCFFYGGSTAMPTYGVFNVGSGGRVFDFGITASISEKTSAAKTD